MDASRHKELQQTIYDGLMKGDEGDSAPFIALTKLVEQLEALLEAVGDAMLSLATGPLKEGYAYSVLREALERAESSPAKELP